MLEGLFAVFLGIDIVIYLWDNLCKIMFIGVIIYKNNCPQEAGIWPCPGHFPHFSQLMVPVKNSAAFRGTRAEPSFWGPLSISFCVPITSNKNKKTFFWNIFILTFLGGYFKYLRGLSWSEVLEVGAVVVWKRKLNSVLLEASDKM